MEIEGDFNFRGQTLGVMATVEYQADKYGIIEYLDITKLLIHSDRRDHDVEASARFIRKFQEEKWNYLEGKCQDNEKYLEELYRGAA